MINIYLCDDNEEVIAQTKEMIQKNSLENNLSITLSTFKRAEDMLFHMDDRRDIPDIIFLDIFMDKINGMETARKLRDDGYDGEIIFLTTSHDFVFEAFDVRSFHYLVKQELSNERFKEVFLKVVEEVDQNQDKYFDCSMGAEVRKIPMKDITYFAIYRRVMRVYYLSDFFEFYETMDNLTKQLEGQGFARTHRAYLVNLRHVAVFKKDTLLLTDGSEIPIGKTYLSDLKKEFNDYVVNRWES
ncbi:LytTR family DNA-binding domain-containing protein [Erysipelothrix urinaevulpis]|uniref:LytR/AlgR family response regulator transcription factor n=1 Tax=Erysipelothrix urinaevulpis TaxID=2683717 RepID=UPI00135C0E8F|nr:LytTR family DNA-binding domain-containing protein [Erysipelothrix urinaevulpis]